MEGAQDPLPNSCWHGRPGSLSAGPSLWCSPHQRARTPAPQEVGHTRRAFRLVTLPLFPGVLPWPLRPGQGSPLPTVSLVPGLTLLCSSAFPWLWELELWSPLFNSPPSPVSAASPHHGGDGFRGGDHVGSPPVWC